MPKNALVNVGKREKSALGKISREELRLHL
jgi:hypothetical protein